MSALRALLVQLAAALLATGLLLVFSRTGGVEPSLMGWAVLQGSLAVMLARILRVERWWLPLHLGFAPAIALALGLTVPPAVYLALLVLLLLVFGLPFRTRVPLFLSSHAVVIELARWLPAGSYEILDIGSGTGRFVAGLAMRRGDCRVTGIELAWLPWWLSRRAIRHLPNAQVLRDDFWSFRLDRIDVVYAFLSPVPMKQLWDKLRNELRAGSWLVSNSFPVPGVQPTEILQLADRRRTTLYCYRMPRQGKEPSRS